MQGEETTEGGERRPVEASDGTGGQAAASEAAELAAVLPAPDAADPASGSLAAAAGDAADPDSERMSAGDPAFEPLDGAAAADGTVLGLDVGEERSPRPETCPFLRRLDPDGSLRAPVEAPDAANRCVATGDARPESSVQQELTCLQAAHAACPRYLRGTAPEPPAVAPSPPRREIPRATIAALLVLLASASAAFTFVLVRGGISLPAVGLSPTVGPAAVASPTVTDAGAPTLAPSTPTGSGSAAPSVGITPSPVASAPSTPPATAAPVPTATAAPTAAPAPTTLPSPVASGGASASRLGILVACSGKPDCFIYTIRSGDNLVSIANYFGVPYARILALNPWITDPAQIRKGDRLTLPTPTR